MGWSLTTPEILPTAVAYLFILCHSLHGRTDSRVGWVFFDKASCPADKEGWVLNDVVTLAKIAMKVLPLSCMYMYSRG